MSRITKAIPGQSFVQLFAFNYKLTKKHLISTGTYSNPVLEKGLSSGRGTITALSLLATVHLIHKDSTGITRSHKK